MKVNVLGAEYTLIKDATVEDYPDIEGCDGYCDWTSKTIVIRAESKEDNSDRFEIFTNKVIRHELIHAFYNESGLQFESHNEQTVDWIALQLPKMAKLFEELEVMK